MRTREIRVVRRIASTREAMWDACATARGLSRWQADEADGSLGAGRFVLRWPQLGAVVALEVVSAREPEQLVLRSGRSTVEMAFDANGIRVTHRGVSEDDEPGLRSSWRASLALLEHSVTVHGGKDRRVHWLVRHVRTTPQAAFAFFTEPEALAAWLTESGTVGTEGSRCSLTLRGGAPITGVVLARSEGGDVVLTWEQDDSSILAMRTLPGAASGQRWVALSWSRWAAALPDATDRLARLETSMERLARALQGGGEA